MSVVNDPFFMNSFENSSENSSEKQCGGTVSDFYWWSVIYWIRNNITGLYYFGQTINYKRRMTDHKLAKDGCTYLCNAVRKHGWNAFRFGIVCEWRMTSRELDRQEIHYIAKFNTCHGPGYNLTKGGKGMKGFVPSARTRQKMSQRKKQYLAANPHYWNDQEKTKISDGLKRYHKRKRKSGYSNHRNGSISFYKRCRHKPYYAKIMMNAVTYYLGYHSTRELAQSAIHDFVKKVKP